MHMWGYSSDNALFKSCQNWCKQLFSPFTKGSVIQWDLLLPYKCCKKRQATSTYPSYLVVSTCRVKFISGKWWAPWSFFTVASPDRKGHGWVQLLTGTPDQSYCRPDHVKDVLMNPGNHCSSTVVAWQHLLKCTRMTTLLFSLLFHKE